MATIYDTLRTFLSLPPEAGEPMESYSRRLALDANKLSDEQWTALGQTEAGRKAQTWVNDVLEANDKKEPLPKLEGYSPKKVAGNGVAPPPKDEPTEAATPAPKGKPKAKAKAPSATPKGKSKPAKAKASAEKRGRGRQGSFDRDAKITLLATENPCVKGSKVHARFEKYKSGMTVQQALDAGLDWSDFRRDVHKKHIKISKP
jgi:hypothetical protein